ncbi:MAG: HAD family hydrolase [Alloprevotella sp.]|nr:HAD family hydrolase [Alloprevotella sp.]MBR1652288.1 HAD family hydrolase [Alloprevotella sp.]
MPYTTFILDLDGTLLDTLQDLTAAVNHAFRLHGLPAQRPEDVRRCLGNGYARLVGDLGGTPDVLADFNAYYGRHCMDLTAPYDGVLPTLAEMRRRGARMAIVSNKGDEAVQQLRRKFFADLVPIAVGESATVRRKPNPDAVLEAMRQLGAAADEAVYVGDSEVDIETARRAGLPCLSCTWGFRSEAHLLAHGASRLLHAPEEILSFVADRA